MGAEGRGAAEIQIGVCRLVEEPTQGVAYCIVLFRTDEPATAGSGGGKMQGSSLWLKLPRATVLSLTLMHATGTKTDVAASPTAAAAAPAAAGRNARARHASLGRPGPPPEAPALPFAPIAHPLYRLYQNHDDIRRLSF